MRLAFLALVVVLVAVAPAHAARWTAPRDLPGAERAVMPFELAVGADGTAAVAYQSEGGVRVVVRRRGTWLRPRTVSRSGGYGESTPKVAVTGSGEVLAVWVRTTSRGAGPTRGPYWIEARTRDRRGRWGSIRKIGYSGHFREPGLDMAVNARGDAVIAWRGVRKVGRRNRDATAAAYRRAGRTFGGVHIVREPEPAGEQAVAIDRYGVAHVVWTSSKFSASRSAIVRHVHRSRSTGWSEPTTVSGAPASRPDVAATHGRSAIVAWRSAGIDTEGEGVQHGVVVTRLRTPSGRWRDSETLSRTLTHSVVLASTPTVGETIAAWIGGAHDGGPVVTAVRSPGGVFGRPLPLAAPGPAGPWPPGLGAVSDGSAVVAWSQRYDLESRGGVHVAVRPARGAFAPVTQLSATGVYPAVAGGRGHAIVVWLDGKGDALRRERLGLRWAQWRP